MEETGKRITKEQKYMLIQYLEAHRDFAHDRFCNSTGVKSLAEQWDALAERLNSVGGALKNGENWKKAWTNMRSKTKQKFQENKNRLERSGINGIQKSKLTELDERIIGIITKECVVGQEEVGEPLREAGIVAEISLVVEDIELPTSSSTSTGVHKSTNTLLEKRKRKGSGRNTCTELLDLEQNILKEKRRKNDIAQEHFQALNSINKSLQSLIKQRQQYTHPY